MANPTSAALAGPLPTVSMGAIVLNNLLDSLRHKLGSDERGHTLVLYHYAPSVGGWRLVEEAISDWLAASTTRSVEAFVGTDHGLTDPLALEEMSAAGVSVSLLTDYSGIYHPKVFLLHTDEGITIWIGSNNLTAAGLSKNIELAFVADAPSVPASIATWDSEIRAASQPLSTELLNSYRSEREKYKKKKAATGISDFLWSRRSKTGATGSSSIPAPTGSLVIEIMPKETGAGGKQIQPPLAVVSSFFGLTSQSKVINASLLGSGSSKQLTLTKMQNHTARLVINELDYGDRPCFMVFQKAGPNTFEYEIVSQSVQPARYAKLKSAAVNQSRIGSRRWAII